MSRYIAKNYESKNDKMSYNGTEEGEACNNIWYVWKIHQTGLAEHLNTIPPLKIKQKHLYSLYKI
jgi:hypothetical protein